MSKTSNHSYCLGYFAAEMHHSSVAAQPLIQTTWVLSLTNLKVVDQLVTQTYTTFPLQYHLILFMMKQRGNFIVQDL